MIPKVDILVVGGGPAGCVAAKIAAEAGARVLLVEAKRRIGERPHCAEWTPRLLGLEVEFPERSIVQTTSNMITRGPGFDARTSAPGFILDRYRFDHGLGERAAVAGAEIRCATRLIALDKKDALLKGPRSMEKIKTELVIAADGGASTIRRLINLKSHRLMTGVQEEVPLAQPLSDTLIRFDPQWRYGYAWLFPKGPVANLGLGMSENRTGEAWEALEVFKMEMIRHGIIRPGRLNRSVGVIPVGGPDEKLVHHHIMFTGDAAGLTHPITGAGIPQAVISGREAGRAALTCLDTGELDRLQEYQYNILDHFGSTLFRALEKRRRLEDRWTLEPFRDLITGAWPAFREHREKPDAVRRRA